MTKERLEELAEKLPESADEAPISAYNELRGREEALELIRLARLGLWASNYREVIHNTLYSAATLESALALKELPDAAR